MLTKRLFIKVSITDILWTYCAHLQNHHINPCNTSLKITIKPFKLILQKKSLTMLSVLLNKV